MISNQTRAKIDGDAITFSSGRTVNANCGIVGINPDLEISHGYDGAIEWPQYEWRPASHRLTAEDMQELADHMIDLWTKFRSTLKG